MEKEIANKEITNIKINMTKLGSDLDHIKDKQDKFYDINEKGHKEIKEMIKGNLDEVKALFVDVDKKKANKWVEDAMVWGIRIVLGTIIIAILSLVIIKI